MKRLACERDFPTSEKSITEFWYKISITWNMIHSKHSPCILLRICIIRIWVSNDHLRILNYKWGWKKLKCPEANELVPWWAHKNRECKEKFLTERRFICHKLWQLGDWSGNQSSRSSGRYRESIFIWSMWMIYLSEKKINPKSKKTLSHYCINKVLCGHLCVSI